MSIRVRLEHGQGAGATWRLALPGVYTLGRVPQSSIQVLDMRVSKEHAEIHIGENGTAVLKDLGSTHGCQVNGQPVNGQVPLKAGDELRLGLSILRVLSDGQADKDATPAAGRTANTGSVPNPAAVETHRTLPPDALVGKELGGYRVERKVGAGGMEVEAVATTPNVGLRWETLERYLGQPFDGVDDGVVAEGGDERQPAQRAPLLEGLRQRGALVLGRHADSAHREARPAHAVEHDLDGYADGVAVGVLQDVLEHRVEAHAVAGGLHRVVVDAGLDALRLEHVGQHLGQRGLDVARTTA